MTFPNASELARELVALKMIHLGYLGLSIFAFLVVVSAFRGHLLRTNEVPAAIWASVTTAYSLYGGVKVATVFAFFTKDEWFDGQKPILVQAFSEAELKLIGLTAGVFGLWSAARQLKKLFVLARVQTSRLLILTPELAAALPSQAFPALIQVDLRATLSDRVYDRDDSIGALLVDKDTFPVFEDDKRGRKAVKAVLIPSPSPKRQDPLAQFLSKSNRKN